MRLVWSRSRNGYQGRERRGGEREFYASVGHREPVSFHHTSMSIGGPYPHHLHLVGKTDKGDGAPRAVVYDGDGAKTVGDVTEGGRRDDRFVG